MTKLYHIKSLRPFLPLQSTAAPLRGFLYPMGGRDDCSWIFRYVVDSKGFWFQKNDKYMSVHENSFHDSEIAAVSGLDLDELELVPFESAALQHSEVQRHPHRYGLPGGEPILPLPFTARQFFDWEKKCLRMELINGNEVHFEHMFFDEEYLAELETTNADSAELVRICLAGIAPEQQHAILPALRVGAVGASDGNKPWLAIHPNDPPPVQPWYTSARYFARQLVVDDSTLLAKRDLLSSKVSQSLAAAGIYKRGGIKAPAADTVKKAFANVQLG